MCVRSKESVHIHPRSGTGEQKAAWEIRGQALKKDSTDAKFQLTISLSSRHLWDQEQAMQGKYDSSIYS